MGNWTRQIAWAGLDNSCLRGRRRSGVWIIRQRGNIVGGLGAVRYEPPPTLRVEYVFIGALLGTALVVAVVLPPTLRIFVFMLLFF